MLDSLKLFRLHNLLRRSMRFVEERSRNDTDIVVEMSIIKIWNLIMDTNVIE